MFYQRVLGLEVIDRGSYALAMRCGRGVLLIFDPTAARRTDRGVPSHGTTGAGHLAFATRPDTLDDWRRHLAACDIEIEMEVDWDQGGRSMYFRDPAGNSVELAPPTLWGGGWRF